MPSWQARAVTLESTVETLLILLFSLVVGLLVSYLHCNEHRECTTAKTCVSTSENFCSFANSVSVIGDTLYGSVSDSTHALLTRGVCAPGERLHTNSVSNKLECAPWRTYPDALNTEVMSEKPVTASTPLHEKFCGAWIAAGDTMRTNVQYLSFYDTGCVRFALT